MENIYKKAVEVWGEEAQLNVLVEELSELIFAIQKLKRTGTEQQMIDRYNNACEEIADVRLMLNQAEYIFDKEKIDKYYDEKKSGVKKRLGL